MLFAPFCAGITVSECSRVPWLVVLSSPGDKCPCKCLARDPGPYACLGLISSPRWLRRNPHFLDPTKGKQKCILLKTEIYLFNEDLVTEYHQMSAYTV